MIQRLINQARGREREPIATSLQPITPQAVELWKAIASRRKPNREETAIYKFAFAREGIKPETPNQHAFLDCLRRYNYPSVAGGNPFEVTLSVNPDPADVSLLVSIWSPTPPKLDHPVLIFQEFPARDEYRPLQFPYNMIITGEGDSIYTEACRYELMGFDTDQKKLIWQESDDREDWLVRPIGDVEFRREFASEALALLTKVALTADPVRAAGKDSRVRTVLEDVRKEGITRWRSKASFWSRILSEPIFFQPWSVAADNFKVMWYRMDVADKAGAAEYMRKYYPHSLQPSPVG
ncbi:MAG: hypothetical protein G01um10147_551 [Microgenomates group bacterium Gr01-1014_7]|nr:MAG: hypothetical protein G01um10147_551 [Microgenomates group bacterium Gr01-1014_7]